MPVTVADRSQLTPELKAQAEGEALAIVEASPYKKGSPYHDFIRLMERWSNEKFKDERGRESWRSTLSIKPYMESAGRIAEANADRDRILIGIQTYLNRGSEPITADYFGTTYVTPPGHGRAVVVRAVRLFDGQEWTHQHFTAVEAIRSSDKGVDATHSLANAETSCVGRALGFAGYGNLPGSSLSPAETMASTPQDDESAAPDAPKADAPRRTRRTAPTELPDLPFEELEGVREYLGYIDLADSVEGLKVVGQSIGQNTALTEDQVAFLKAKYVARLEALKHEVVEPGDDAAA